MNPIPSFDNQNVIEDDLLCGVGRMICAWGLLEQRLEHKIGILRESAGDVRTVGARTKPSIAKMMAELRAMISMRDRRNAAILTEIAAIERDIQRIDRFRGLIVAGFQAAETDGFVCRDQKNVAVHISLNQLSEEIAHLESVGNRLLAL